MRPELDSRAQRQRRTQRFGAAWVREAEALVDAMAETPGGLHRENVLSLMEGAFLRGVEAGKAGGHVRRAAGRSPQEDPRPEHVRRYEDRPGPLFGYRGVYSHLDP